MPEGREAHVAAAASGTAALLTDDVIRIDGAADIVEILQRIGVTSR
jgi:hypothetical protein